MSLVVSPHSTLFSSNLVDMLLTLTTMLGAMETFQTFKKTIRYQLQPTAV